MSGVAQLVVALEGPGEAEQLVLDLVEVALGAGRLEQRLGVGAAMRLGLGHQFEPLAPTWSM